MSWRKSCGNTMLSRLNAVLHNNFPDIPHDVTFMVGEEKKTISCHKIFLAVASPVFEAMFSYRHKTTNENVKINNVTEISIPDVDPAGLQNLIQYAYTGVVSVDIEDAVVTMFTADKYDIPELVAYCSDLLQKNLNLQAVNVVRIYKVAILLNDVELQEKVCKYIAGNFYRLLKLKEFLEFSSENLCSILKLDNLTVDSELNVFRAVLGWANHQCDVKGVDKTSENCRTELINILPHIRFSTMSADEFNGHVEPTGVLTKDECYDLYKYFSLSGENRLTLSKTFKRKRDGAHIFNAIFAPLSPNDTFRNILDTAEGKYSLSTENFIVSGDIPDMNLKLKSIGFIAPQNAQAVITITEYDPTQVDPKIYKIDRQTLKKVNEQSVIQYVDLPDLAPIKPNVKYNIIVCLQKGQLAYFPKQSEFLPFVDRSSPDRLFTITLKASTSLIWALEFQY